MNQVTILFFATLRDRAGLKSLDLQIPVETTVAEFKYILTEQLPGLKGLLGHSVSRSTASTYSMPL